MSESNIESVFSEQAAEPQEQAPEVVQEPVEQATGEEVAAAPAEPQEDQFEKHRKGLEAAAVAERNKRQAVEARNYALEKQLAALQKPAHQTAGLPDPSQYTDVMQFAEDYANAKNAQDRQAWQQEQQREQIKREIDARTTSVISDGRGKYQDFDQSLESLRPVLAEVDFRNALVLRGGPDVAYHLSKDLGEAYRIASLPTSEMLLEIAELRGMLKGRPAAPVAPAPAPLPIPRTLTDTRNAQGQYAPRQSDHTPLESLFERK